MYHPDICRANFTVAFSALSAGVALGRQHLAVGLSAGEWPELPSLAGGAKPNRASQTAAPGKAAQIGIGETGFGGSWHEIRADILHLFTSSSQ